MKIQPTILMYLATLANKFYLCDCRYLIGTQNAHFLTFFHCSSFFFVKSYN